MGIQLAKTGSGLVVQPRDMNELWQFCKTISESSFVPKDFRNRPGDVLAAVQMGAELGLAPLAALQNIAVINGRPSIWGDALLAIILAHPECHVLEETYDAATKTARCRVVRKRPNGMTREVCEEFSWADAEAAKLTGKDTYKQYGKRMLKMRARGFALRDAFADVLKGLLTREEAQDIPQPIATLSVVTSAPSSAIDATPPPKQVEPDTRATFGKKWVPEWAGQPIEEAPASVVAQYAQHLEELLGGALSEKAMIATTLHRDEVQRIFDEMRMLEDESRPDPIASGLENFIDEQRGGSNTDWGMEGDKQ